MTTLSSVKPGPVNRLKCTSPTCTFRCSAPSSAASIRGRNRPALRNGAIKPIAITPSAAGSTIRVTMRRPVTRSPSPRWPAVSDNPPDRRHPLPLQDLPRRFPSLCTDELDHARSHLQAHPEFPKQGVSILPPDAHAAVQKPERRRRPRPAETQRQASGSSPLGLRRDPPG